MPRRLLPRRHGTITHGPWRLRTLRCAPASARRVAGCATRRGERRPTCLQIVAPRWLIAGIGCPATSGDACDFDRIGFEVEHLALITDPEDRSDNPPRRPRRSARGDDLESDHPALRRNPASSLGRRACPDLGIYDQPKARDRQPSWNASLFRADRAAEIHAPSGTARLKVPPDVWQQRDGPVADHCEVPGLRRHTDAARACCGQVRFGRRPCLDFDEVSGASLDEVQATRRAAANAKPFA
jgi:hypothetical protein